MTLNSKTLFLSSLFILMYCFILYYSVQTHLTSDFAAFYFCSKAFIHNSNPYIKMQVYSLLESTSLLPSINTPFFLLLISPLTYFSYQSAYLLWSIISLLLGISGALLSFRLCSSDDFFRKKGLFMLFVYLAMFPTLMNTIIGQIGAVLLFFLVAGYSFYIKEQDGFAGFIWGIIIAIKLFPALLFFFVLGQRRYKVFCIMLLVFAVASVLPVLKRGFEIYYLYFTMLPQIIWYGDNWNASLYGMLFRLFIDVTRPDRMQLVQLSFMACFLILLGWYFKKILSHQPRVGDHWPFCFTLAMMLFLSPMGWVYYFPILIMPLTLIWNSLDLKEGASRRFQFFVVLCLFLINFPIGNVVVTDMSSSLLQLSVFSISFYGLLLVVALLNRIKSHTLSIPKEYSPSYLFTLNTSLGLGLFIALSNSVLGLWPH